jgi:chemotaxis protein CheC
MNAQNALTTCQADALTELINIAFGLTAAKLSEISGSRVVLNVPTIAIHPVRALVSELKPFVTGPAASVHQVFSGPISGDAILLINYDGAVKLSNLLVEEHLRAKRLDSSTGEILTEVGNMLLSACLGVFGNLLRVHVMFSIPQLHLDSLEHFLTSVSIGGDELRYAVVITSSFNIFNQEVDGRLVILLGVSSLERLIQAVEQWEGSQSSA